MKIKYQALILIFSLMWVVLPDSIQGRPAGSEEDLPQHQKTWLEVDAAYILTPKEREVFLQLQSDQERDIFINAFWKQRDPTPGTPANEFKTEHHRRIAYANEFLGRETTRPGWMTDRGRIYILLGAPLDISRSEGETFVYPTQIWSYKGDPELGLPGHFNLVFYKRRGMGGYVLYSPTGDGPMSLLINYQGDAISSSDAYQQLRKYDRRLAQVSLSLIPGEPLTFGQPSLASEQLIGRIYGLHERIVDSRYAEVIFKYKDVVEVEYTANYIGCDSLASVIQDESGIFFVHYLVQPDILSVLSYRENFSLNFDMNGIITDSSGHVIFQYDKTFPVDFNSEQIRDIQQTSVVIQDAIPLTPGDYTFNLLLKNTVSKEFTSFEKMISVPDDPESIGISPLLLGYELKKVPAQPRTSKPFTIAGHQILCQAQKVFHPTKSLVVFFQTFGLPEELVETGKVEFLFLRQGVEFQRREVDLSKLSYRNIFQEFALDEFSPDYYKIRVSLTYAEDRVVASADADFEVSSRSDIPRPWIISKVMPPSEHIMYAYVLGNQLVKKGDLDGAEPLLARAHRESPASLLYAVGYAELLIIKSEYRRAKEVLLPFSDMPGENHQAMALLGASSQALGQYQEAVRFYKAFLVYEGTNLNILNSIGECYLRMGNTEEARIAWEKSLEINPDQESIRTALDRIKKIGIPDRKR
ncbi:GWxTD domain-containing protein [Acidobacteriota bacterium]